MLDAPFSLLSVSYERKVVESSQNFLFLFVFVCKFWCNGIQIELMVV
jgi:hypothetical protein